MELHLTCEQVNIIICVPLAADGCIVNAYGVKGELRFEKRIAE